MYPPYWGYFFSPFRIFALAMETKKTKRDTKGSKEHKKSWQETYASIDDIMTFLDNHVMLRHNVVTARVEYRIPTTYYNKTPTEWQPINDRVVWRMGDHTDRVDYAPDGEGTWELIIHRDIPLAPPSR